MSDNEEGDQLPKSSFSTYVAEGDQLYLKGKYIKAIESYTTALVLQPDDKNCLVARSKRRGFSEEDKEFFKGLYQKAEALYTMGDFEFALVFFHRGHKLRPELQEFRLGIQKAQEAIDNSVGSPSSVKLENKGDLSFFHKKDEQGKTVKPKGIPRTTKKEQNQQNKKSPKSEKTAKQLLGELYSDKEYLEKLLKDEDLIKGEMRSGEKVQDLILSCIHYLDTRTEFWRQQKPVYARERDRKLMQQKWNKSQQSPPSNPTVYVLKSLEEIEVTMAAGNVLGSLKKAQRVLKTVQRWSEVAVPNKNEVLGNLHSCIGNALIDMEDMDGALESHRKDLDLARQSKLTDAKSRALDNIGRVYARIGKYMQAIEAWEEKIPLVRNSLEKTWLFHEIGRCYLELEHYKEARNYGLRSLEAADETGDEKWQLNASVLVAQSEVKLGNHVSGVAHFERALERAMLLRDSPAKEAIQKALSEARQYLAEESK
ncbi:hypothetical protein AAFF_G00052240 [Aldrovandia affinis]|uniref:Outer dynein arm-docking complex subunit 4 n=1 Tax=Aldrovandia affinis TaxID=143900 RepID=A0AAD7T4Q2_9TELE|nr:hypothetical protein AAFF_G00052240 [Aldrovandia affinis]